MSKISYLRKPLTEKQIVARAKKGQLKVVVAYDFSDLISAGKDGVNDLADHKILGPDSHHCLNGLDFKPVGVIVKRSLVLVEVTADVSDLLRDIDDVETWE